MKIYKCDFCGKIINNDYELEGIDLSYLGGHKPVHEVIIDDAENYDVCDKCYDKILALADIKKED